MSLWHKRAGVSNALNLGPQVDQAGLCSPVQLVGVVDVLDVVEVQEVLHAGEILLLVDRHLLAHAGQHALHQDVLNLRKYFV